MWRYTTGFFLSAFISAVFWQLLTSQNSLGEGLVTVGGVLLIVYWLGEGLFVRGFISDENDAKRLKDLMDKRPQFGRLLWILGLASGLVSVAATLPALAYFGSTSLWVVAGIPILIFSAVLLFLLWKVKLEMRAKRVSTERSN
jgi:hypothetical protein